MKLVNKLTVVAALATFMFAGVNLTWGNMYENVTNAGTGVDELKASHSFGVWMDVNDATAFGWENGLKVGFDGPAGMQMRLGFDPEDGTATTKTTLGVSRSWWTSTGNGWGTNLSTAIDWTMTGAADEPGEFALTMNLGFGF